MAVACRSRLLFEGTSPRRGNPKTTARLAPVFEAAHTMSLAARSLDLDVEFETGVGKSSEDAESFAA